MVVIGLNGSKMTAYKRISKIWKFHWKVVSLPQKTKDWVMESNYTIPRNGLLSVLSSVSIEDIPMAVKYLVDKLAVIRKQEAVDHSSHIWDDYQLSAEVIAMAPSERKSIYGDYDAELMDIFFQNH